MRYIHQRIESGIQTLKERYVILTSLPQSDGRVKNRPAVILRKMPVYGDLLVCGVSSQLQHYLTDFDEKLYGKMTQRKTPRIVKKYERPIHIRKISSIGKFSR